MSENKPAGMKKLRVYVPPERHDIAYMEGTPRESEAFADYCREADERAFWDQAFTKQYQFHLETLLRHGDNKLIPTEQMRTNAVDLAHLDAREMLFGRRRVWGGQ